MEGEIGEVAKNIWANAVESLIELDESEGWEIFKRKDDWVGMRKKTDVFYTLKGECLVNADPQPIIDFIRVPENKPLFDGGIESAEMLHDVDGNLRIILNKIITPAIISKRDVVFVQGIKEVDGDTYIASKSVEFPARPALEGVIRAEVIIAGYIIRPIEPGKSTLAYIMNVDPRGDLPSVIVNGIQKTQIKNVIKIREHVLKGN